MKGDYLSEIINLDDIVTGKLNLIVSPCGSGKTTFAKQALKELNQKRVAEIWHNIYQLPVLYLIDTAIGKEQLLHGKDASVEINPWTEELQWILNGITVMTYAGYATLCEKAPRYDVWAKNAVIVCDELHSPIKWSKWGNNDDDNIHKTAVGIIAQRVELGNNIVVAMSATPKIIEDEFSWCLHKVKLHKEPKHYEDRSVENYNNLSLLLNKINKEERGIIYVSQINEILKYEKILKDRGLTTASLWSVNNKKFPLNTEQIDVRNYIINNREMPPYIDVLFINRSCETSITIGDETNTKYPIDYIIIHSADKDTQIQVRGRYRNDLNKLYLHKPISYDSIILQNEWLFKPLYKKDKNNLCNQLSIKNENNGRLYGWSTIKKIIEYSGYIVEDFRSNKERYSVISEI